MQLRPLIIMISAGALVASSFAAYSNTLRDSFDYYKRNPSGTYTTSGMRGYVGPSFSARNNTVNPRIVSVQMPTWSGGCGGIDFFAGSFAIVTKDELVQMGRGIVQGAPGYFFNLAVAAVCPTCQQQMAGLQAKLEKFNEFTQNSCSDAWDLFENMDENKTMTARARGWAESWGVNLDGKDGHITDASAWLAKKWGGGEDSNPTPNMTDGSVGNKTADLVEKNVNTTPAGILSDITTPELYVSIFGGVIVTQSGVAPNPNELIFTPVVPTLKFKDILWNSATQTITLQRCAGADPTCKTMAPQPLQFEGLVARNKRLINSNDPANFGIFPSLRSGTTLPSADAQALKNNTRYPFEEKIRQHADNPNIDDTLAELLALQIAREQLSEFYINHKDTLHALTLVEGADLPSLLTPEHIKQSITVADAQFAEAIASIDTLLESVSVTFAIFSNLKHLTSKTK